MGTSHQRTTRRAWFITLIVSGLAIVVIALAASSNWPISQSKPDMSSDQSQPGIGASEAKSRGVFAAPGDGTVVFVESGSPVVRSQATALHFRVRNAGDANAMYTITLSSSAAPFDQHKVTIPVEGGQAAQATITIDTSDLAPGHYSVTAALTSNLLDVDPLSSDTAVVNLIQ